MNKYNNLCEVFCSHCNLFDYDCDGKCERNNAFYNEQPKETECDDNCENCSNCNSN